MPRERTITITRDRGNYRGIEVIRSLSPVRPSSTVDDRNSQVRYKPNPWDDEVDTGGSPSRPKVPRDDDLALEKHGFKYEPDETHRRIDHDGLDRRKLERDREYREATKVLHESQHLPGVFQTVFDVNRPQDASVHLELLITDDYETELEAFSRLQRLGNFGAAQDYFKDRLEPYMSDPYVFIHFGQMLLDKGDFIAFERLNSEAVFSNEGCQTRRLGFETDVRPVGSDVRRSRMGHYRFGHDNDQDRRHSPDGRPVVQGTKTMFDCDELELLRQNWRLMEATSAMHRKGDYENAYTEAWSAIDNFRFGTEIGSTEIQVVVLALHLCAQLGRAAPARYYNELQKAAGEWLDWSGLVKRLLVQGRIWDFKDLYVAAVAAFFDSADEMFFGTSGIKRSLIDDWVLEKEDESTVLAQLDLLLQPAQSQPFFLDEAKARAEVIMVHFPTAMKSRSFIRWIIVNAADAFHRENKGEGDPWLAYKTHLEGYSGMAWHSPGWLMPCLYVPRHNENPGWIPSEGSQVISEPLQLALNLADELKDYDSQAACYKQLIFQSQDPTQLFEELANLQKNMQGKKQAHLETLLSSYSICKDRPAKERLLKEFEQTDDWGDAAMLYWARDFIERAVKRSLEGPHSDVRSRHPASFYMRKGLPREAEEFIRQDTDLNERLRSSKYEPIPLPPTRASFQGQRNIRPLTHLADDRLARDFALERADEGALLKARAEHADLTRERLAKEDEDFSGFAKDMQRQKPRGFFQGQKEEARRVWDRRDASVESASSAGSGSSKTKQQVNSARRIHEEEPDEEACSDKKWSRRNTGRDIDTEMVEADQKDETNYKSPKQNSRTDLVIYNQDQVARLPRAYAAESSLLRSPTSPPKDTRVNNERDAARVSTQNSSNASSEFGLGQMPEREPTPEPTHDHFQERNHYLPDGPAWDNGEAGDCREAERMDVEGRTQRRMSQTPHPLIKIQLPNYYEDDSDVIAVDLEHSPPGSPPRRRSSSLNLREAESRDHNELQSRAENIRITSRAPIVVPDSPSMQKKKPDSDNIITTESEKLTRPAKAVPTGRYASPRPSNRESPGVGDGWEGGIREKARKKVVIDPSPSTYSVPTRSRSPTPEHDYIQPLERRTSWRDRRTSPFHGDQHESPKSRSLIVDADGRPQPVRTTSEHRLGYITDAASGTLICDKCGEGIEGCRTIPEMSPTAAGKRAQRPVASRSQSAEDVGIRVDHSGPESSTPEERYTEDRKRGEDGSLRRRRKAMSTLSEESEEVRGRVPSQQQALPKAGEQDSGVESPKPQASLDPEPGISKRPTVADPEPGDD